MAFAEGFGAGLCSGMVVNDSLSKTAVNADGAGVGLSVAREIGQVRDLLEHAGAGVLADHVHPTVTAAVVAAQKTIRTG